MDSVSSWKSARPKVTNFIFPPCSIVCITRPGGAAAAGRGRRAQMLARAAGDTRHSIGMPLSEAAERVFQRTLEPALRDLDERERVEIESQIKMMSQEEIVRYALDG